MRRLVFGVLLTAAMGANAACGIKAPPRPPEVSGPQGTTATSTLTEAETH